MPSVVTESQLHPFPHGPLGPQVALCLPARRSALASFQHSGAGEWRAQHVAAKSPALAPHSRPAGLVVFSATLMITCSKTLNCLTSCPCASMVGCFSSKTSSAMRSAAGLSMARVESWQRCAAPPSCMPQRRSRPRHVWVFLRQGTDHTDAKVENWCCPNALFPQQQKGHMSSQM